MMRAVREWLLRFWHTVRLPSAGRLRADDDLEDEIRSHFELAADAARHQGDSVDSAVRVARLRAGGVAQALEAVRDQRRLPWLDDLARDLRHGLSGLVRTPGFAAVAIATLALGVGANTAIFSVVNGVLLRPLPYAQPDRLVSAGFLMAGEYLVLRDHVQTVETFALSQAGRGFNLSDGGAAVRLTGAYASANLFETLGVSPLLGRTFLPEEEAPGADGVVLLSHGLWRERFAADTDVVGRTILVDSEPRTVVGVMPAGLSFPAPGTQLWVPYVFDRGDAAALWGEGLRGGFGLARLRPGVTPRRAQEDLRALGPLLRESNTLWLTPPDYGQTRLAVPLREELVGSVRTRLLIILGAVGFVLLIACANVANLLLARAGGRQREVAVRRALGAARGRLIRQLLTESAVLAAMGGVAGLALAFSAVRLLVSRLPADIPRAAEVGVDGRVLAFTLVISLLTGLVFGIVPAIRATRSDARSGLKTEGRGSSASLGRTASLLVVGEVAVAVVLAVGAGLLIRSFAALVRVEPGFRIDQVITAHVTPPERRYASPERQRAFYDEVVRRVRALPGVQAVELVSGMPLSGDAHWFAFETADDPSAPGDGASMTNDRRVTAGYLGAMGIPLVAGRDLADTDGERMPRVAVVNQTMAREHWPGEDPIGKRFKEVWLDEWTTVVGVAGDVRHDGLASRVMSGIYRPFLQVPARDMWLAIRSASTPTNLSAPIVSGLRDAVAAVDPTVPVSEIRTVEELVSRSVASPRFTTLLLGAFAGLALALAAIGLYGVLSHVVSRRTREIGVRMALGAPRGAVLRMVLGQALGLSATGITLGLLGALAATRLLESLLFGVSPTDPITFAVVPIVLVAVALLAAGVPAGRATRVDPTTALRFE